MSESYEEILRLTAYLLCLWYAGRVVSGLGFSSIPAEIAVGIVFGGHGANLISEFSEEYAPLQLLGFIGVSFVIFNSGMHLNVNKLVSVDIGLTAAGVAALGTLLPIALGILFFYILGFDAYPDGLAAGFSLAPTSVGISLSLLSKSKQLHSRFGQITILAAFTDDIFSIICLVVLINLGSGRFEPVQHVVYPFLQAAALVLFGMIGSVYCMPHLMRWLLRYRKGVKIFQDGTRSLAVKDEIHLTALFAVYTLLSWIGHLTGSALLGSFVAGMLFSNVPRSEVVWSRQFKRVTAWLLRLFFGATVAFTIRVDSLLTVDAFWKGFIIGLIPCLLSKVVCAFFIGPERWVVGVAMMARGEFAYLVAEEARDLDLLSDKSYSIVVWALLWATIVPPIIFSNVLQRYVLELLDSGNAPGRSERIGGEQYSAESSFIIRLIGKYHIGMVREICDMLFSHGLEVLQSNTESDGLIGTGTFVVCLREAVAYKNKHKLKGKGENGIDLRKYKIVCDLDDDKLDELAQALKETIGDGDAVALFEHADKEDEVETLRIMEIKLVGDRCGDILPELVNYLKFKCFLHVSQAVTSDKEEHVVLYCRQLRAGEVLGNIAGVAAEAKEAEDNNSGIVRSNTDGSIQLTRQLSDSSIFRDKSIEKFTRVYPKIHADRHLCLSDMKPGLSDTAEKNVIAAKRLLSSHMYHTVESAFSAAQRDHIRGVVRNLYASHGLSGGYALVKMIHEDEMLAHGNMGAAHVERRGRSAAVGGHEKETSAGGRMASSRAAISEHHSPSFAVEEGRQDVIQRAASSTL